MNKRLVFLRIFSTALLLCGILLPMYGIFPEGLLPREGAWRLADTIGAFAERGLGAFDYIGAVFHLAVFLPGTALCTGAFGGRKRLARISAITGAVLLLIGLAAATALTGEAALIHPTNGYICIGYWVDLALFAVCALCTRQNVKCTEKRH